MGLRQNIIVYCAGQQHHPLVCALPFEANTLTHTTVLCYVCSKVCTWQGVSRKSGEKAGKYFQLLYLIYGIITSTTLNKSDPGLNRITD